MTDVQASRQSWYALSPVLPSVLSAVNHRRTTAAALLLFAAPVFHVHGDAAGGEAPVASSGDSHCAQPCAAVADAEATDSGVDWEEAKREGGEAIEAWGKAARAAARDTWTAARTRSKQALSATEAAGGETLHTVRDASATALDSTRQGAKQIWEDAAGESKQLWQEARPKVAGAVTDAAREGGKALDAARQAGQTFWRVLTAEDAGKDAGKDEE